MNNIESQSLSQSSSDNQSILSQQEQKIKEQLKNMPYQYLLKYHQQHKQSNKNEGNNKIKKNKKINKLVNTQINQQGNKNAPKQVKIMKTPPRQQFKPIFQSNKTKRIDPRFQDYAGTYNAQLAQKSYSFIPKIQQKQARQLKKSLKSKRIKAQDRQRLMKSYNRITSDIRANQIRGIEKNVKHDFKKNKNFIPKKKQFKQQVQRVKLSRMNEVDQKKRIQKKNKKIQKKNIIQRKRVMK